MATGKRVNIILMLELDAFRARCEWFLRVHAQLLVQNPEWGSKTSSPNGGHPVVIQRQTTTLSSMTPPPVRSRDTTKS